MVPEEFDDVVTSVAAVDDVRVVVAALDVFELSTDPLWISESCFRSLPRPLGSVGSCGRLCCLRSRPLAPFDSPLLCSGSICLPFVGLCEDFLAFSGAGLLDLDLFRESFLGCSATRL